VKLGDAYEELAAFTIQWVGKSLVPYQSDVRGQPVAQGRGGGCSEMAQVV
jgi:hypothetical protein